MALSASKVKWSTRLLCHVAMWLLLMITDSLMGSSGRKQRTSWRLTSKVLTLRVLRICFLNSPSAEERYWNCASYGCTICRMVCMSWSKSVDFSTATSSISVEGNLEFSPDLDSKKLPVKLSLLPLCFLPAELENTSPSVGSQAPPPLELDPGGVKY